jgi:hypothetical protein
VHKFVTNKNTWAVISLVMQFYPFLTVGYDIDVYFWTHVQQHSTYSLYTTKWQRRI